MVGADMRFGDMGGSDLAREKDGGAALENAWTRRPVSCLVRGEGELRAAERMPDAARRRGSSVGYRISIPGSHRQSISPFQLPAVLANAANLEHKPGISR